MRKTKVKDLPEGFYARVVISLAGKGSVRFSVFNAYVVESLQTKIMFVPIITPDEQYEARCYGEETVILDVSLVSPI